MRRNSSNQAIAPVSLWHKYARYCGLVLGLVATAVPLCLDAKAGVAQSDKETVPILSQVSVLFVNPTVGNDAGGNGTELKPFKTITNALRVAGRNTVILLAPGTYSTSSGETFPLLLKNGVTIQGNPRSRGQDIVIKGGGVFESQETGSQNVTIVGATHAGLTGVTLTNPNQRGYGLWIESSSPVVVDNTFTGNALDGISVSGNSAPLIRSNYLYGNGANGIAISGTSRPEVRDNVLSNKGAGISISQNASPRLTGNRISNNKDGVVVEGNAEPILRNNIIINNERDGFVAIASPHPDLGTAAEPGGNTFRGNGRFDISNKASNQLIAGFGNQASNRIEGSIDLASQSSINKNNPPAVVAGSSVAVNQQPTAVTSPPSTASNASQTTSIPVIPSSSQIANATAAPTNQQPKISTSIPINTTSRPLAMPTPTIPAPTEVVNPPDAPNPAISKQQETPMEAIPPTNVNNFQSLPIVKVTSNIQPSASNNTTNRQQTQFPSVSASSFPIPTSLNPQTPIGNDNRQQTPVNGQQITFEIPAVNPSPSSIPQINQSTKTSPQNTLPQLPVFPPSPVPKWGGENDQTLNSLTVPSQNMPPGSTNNNTSQASWPKLEPQGKMASASGLHYRVVVEADSDSQKTLVRSLVPDAFRIVLKGRTVMQVGAYSDRAYAEEMRQMLGSKGLKASIEQVN